MPRSAREYLHILDEALYLLEKSGGVSQEVFSKDETLKRAFVRSIEVIGTNEIPILARHIEWILENEIIEE